MKYDCNAYEYLWFYFLIFVSNLKFLIFRLANYGKFIGERLLDVIFLRERGYKRETKLLATLIFIKSTIWKNLFGKEADKLERSNDDPKTCQSPLLSSLKITSSRKLLVISQGIKRESSVWVWHTGSLPDQNTKSQVQPQSQTTPTMEVINCFYSSLSPLLS